jgi:hypothetical protein
MVTPKLYADFNGLFSDILCLSHSDTAVESNGTTVRLCAGMKVIAFDEDADETGKREYLIASGTVERSPDWLACRGSKWVLRIDSNGVRHESDIT